jgi:hypothetical protein
MARPAIRSKVRLGEHGLPLAIVGVALWLVAALVVRSFPGMFEGRWRLALMMLAMIPLAEVVLLLVGIVLGFERPKRLPAAALVAMVGLAMHALALVWWPSLYGTDEMIVRHGAAWIALAFAALVGMAWHARETA